MEIQSKEGVLAQPHATDNENVQFFSEKAKEWWNKEGCLNGLHTLNKLRVPFIIDNVVDAQKINEGNGIFEKPLEGLDVLEVGCGGGILTEALCITGCKITGLDLSCELINVAKYHTSLNPDLSNITYINTSIEEHAAQFCEKYDVVVCSEVLEHVTDKENLLAACVKCLKPGGSIIVTTFDKTFMSWWMGIIVTEYILRFTPRGTHEWSKFISPEDVTKLLKERGCNTKNIRGIKYHYFVFPKEWYWSSYTNVNYALHAVKES